jgi:hypothetical protein
VFEGRVSKLTPLGESDLVVELSVVRSWKAANTEHILLRTRQDSAACGFPFAPNESYLIYADAAPNDASLPGLEVLHCGRTKPMSEADADIAELGMGVVPVSARKDDVVAGDDTANTNTAIAEQQAKPAGAGCSRCSALGAHVRTPGPTGSAALLSLSATLLWTLRRRRRRREASSEA